MASLIPQLAAGLPDPYRPALPVQPATPVTRAQRLAAALQQAQMDAGNPDAPYLVNLPSYEQYAFHRPGAFDDVQLPPVSFGGDPDKMGRVRQAGGILTDNALRSALTGHNPDAPDWVNAGADAANTGSLTGMPLVGAIRAFHGSPHDFDAFDMSKIGTGEGAQAYGHGLYFAENLGVADAYKKALAGEPKVGLTSVFDDQPWMTQSSKGLARGALQNALAEGKTGDEAALAAAKTLNDQGHLIDDNFTRQPYYDAANSLVGLRGKDWHTSPGRTYEVSIDAHPDEFLDWDKPLSEQSPQVQAALRKAPFMEPDMLRHLERNPQTPARVSVSTPEQAEALRAAGIKGIRYADQGSRANVDTNNLRGSISMYQTALRKHPDDANLQQMLADAQQQLAAAEKGKTHNYVVFDAKTIAILKKYGIAGLTAGGAAAAVARSGLPSEKTQEQSDTGRQLPVAVLGVRG